MRMQSLKALTLWCPAEPMRALVLRKVKAAFHFTCSHLVALTLAATAFFNLVRTWTHERHQQRGWLSLIEACQPLSIGISALVQDG